MKKWSGEDAAAIESLRKRIEKWRKTRQKVSPMPVPLWREASSLAAKHGICRIAKAVRIDYAALKRKLEKTAGSSRRSFVELPTPAFTSSRDEAVIELNDDSGAKMTVRVAGRSEIDVVALTDSFWRRA